MKMVFRRGVRVELVGLGHQIEVLELCFEEVRLGVRV